MEYTVEAFAANLRAERARSDMTRDQLAEAAKVSAKSLANYESGVAAPTLANALSIANAIGVDLNTLCKANL